MPVKTRSQFNIDIDFDYASICWRENKKEISKGIYKYKCMGNTKSGNCCRAKPLDHSNFCRLHNLK